MAEPSPFPYQGPLEPAQVTGREAIAADLAERIMQRRLTALLGPRRFGKTSLLKRVTADLGQVGPDTIWIDLYQISSMTDLAGAIDRGLAQVTGPTRRVLESIAGGASLRLGFAGIELSKSRRERPDPVLTLRALLEVLVRTAQRRDLILVLDEFSGIAGVEGAAGVLRSELQHHFQQLAIVFAGSEPSTMRSLFTDQAAPFFAQADIVELGPLDDVAVGEIVRNGFTSTGRDVSDHAIDRLVGLAAGHPQRAMQLADALWRLTDPGTAADDDTWHLALEDVRRSVDIGSERLFALLPAGHQKVLRVVSSGGSVYGTAADALALSRGTARAAVEALQGTGYLDRRTDALSGRDRLVVVDPLLADWLRRRFTY